MGCGTPNGEGPPASERYRPKKLSTARVEKLLARKAERKRDKLQRANKDHKRKQQP